MTESATPADRKARGKEIRKTVPRSSHAVWAPPADRADPVTLITDQDTDRLQFLVPIRHYRMAESAFTFYRGTAKVMAADLAGTPATGLTSQLCGDAHLSNFGSFATPTREQIFDTNDFDETLPGPWEWDLKRLVASFVLAGRDNGFDDADTREMTSNAVVGYQNAMAKFTTMTTLDVWYAHLTMQQITDAVPKKKDRKRVEKDAAKDVAKRLRVTAGLHGPLAKISVSRANWRPKVCSGRRSSMTPPGTPTTMRPAPLSRASAGATRMRHCIGSPGCSKGGRTCGFSAGGW